MKDKLSLLPAFFIVFLDLLSLGLVVPVLTPIFFGHNATLLPETYSFATRSLLYGLINAVYPIGQFFGAPILGALSDNYGRKPVMIVSLFGTLIGNIIFALSIITGNLPLLFAGRILAGFTGGNVSTATSAVADKSTPKTKSGNFGFLGLAVGLGLVLGPFIGGRLSDHTLVSWFNYVTPFWFACALSALGILSVIFLFKETLKVKVQTKVSFFTGIHELKHAFTIKKLRIILLVIFLSTLGFNFFIYFFQVFVYEKFKTSETQIGNLFAYAGVWLAISLGGLNSIISKKMSPQRIVLYSLLLLALTLPCLLLPKKLKTLFIVLPFIAIFEGLVQPNITSIISNLAGEDVQGEIMGINQSIQSLAQIIPPIVAGVAISININYPILLAALFSFLGWLVYLQQFNVRKKVKAKYVEPVT